MENNLSKPEFTQTADTLFDRISRSVILKIAVIFFITLILLIPMNMVHDLISERKNREDIVAKEIASKWGLDQVISTPILAVPYPVLKENSIKSADGTQKLVELLETEWAFLMADQVAITAEVNPEARKRGIYETVVYTSQVKIKGNFSKFDLDKLKLDSQKLNWKEAKLVFGIEDFKGLAKNPILKWKEKEYELTKDHVDLNLFPQSLYVNLPLEQNEDAAAGFEIKMDIKGSNTLNFLPLAKQTSITTSGTWKNPSFSGNFIPDQRDVNESFSAQWNIPSFSRKMPQEWNGSSNRIYEFMGLELTTELSAQEYEQIDTRHVDFSKSNQVNQQLLSNDWDMVQVRFLPQVNNYQKTTRVTKFGILVVALSFVSLIFLEIIKRKKIHLIQYILIGFAMVLFYALLLAISEHIGFNWAYVIASLLTITLISSFVGTITKNWQSSSIFGLILSTFYVFIFVLLQLRDYSLIVGTIGIFVILAILMRLSTKIDWYQYEQK
ncbi:cell envelope integrity protein CreD [Sphingobacterium sp. HJSM2_6]|uniref:cell envelope integrity protein CreD n=1 Tax=Sphingobacterium sp. HJSM2_6 TaxID=3366264 RepID=UPI003BC77AB2